MSNFAKIFQSEKFEQLVVIMQGSVDDHPEIRIFMKPAGYGVCSVALQYEDSDSGWDKCEANFEKFDLAQAEAAAMQVFSQIP